MPEAALSQASAFDRLLAGDQAALARAISLIEAGGGASDRLAQRLIEHTGRARVFAVTGPPGAGKSTLIDALISRLREAGESVAVLAVDPSSPLSGGAVLGDRTRMGEHSGDRHVFIRSIAARGHLGGLSLTVPAIIDAADAAGWPYIILETVGAGQSETEVAEFADVKLVVNAPGLGDDIQAIKAGILEIADILVVNKADRPLAERTLNQLKGMLELRPEARRDVPILSTIATTSEGVDALLDCIVERLDAKAHLSTEERVARRLSAALLRRVEVKLKERAGRICESEIGQLCLAIRAGTDTLDAAAERLIQKTFQDTLLQENTQ